MDPKIIAFIWALALVILWFGITVGGLVYSIANLLDARKLLRWQRASGINGARELLARGHVRTSILRSSELASSLVIALVTVFKPHIGNWINVVLVFVIVAAISGASWLDRRDRHKLAAQKD